MFALECTSRLAVCWLVSRVGLVAVKLDLDCSWSAVDFQFVAIILFSKGIHFGVSILIIIWSQKFVEFTACPDLFVSSVV